MSKTDCEPRLKKNLPTPDEMAEEVHKVGSVNGIKPSKVTNII